MSVAQVTNISEGHSILEPVTIPLSLRLTDGQSVHGGEGLHFGDDSDRWSVEQVWCGFGHSAALVSDRFEGAGSQR